MNKVTVNIQGLEFTLKGEESEAHLQTIATTVDELLATMMKSNRKLNISAAAILTSCNLVDEKLKLQETMDSFDSRQAAQDEEKSQLQRQIGELQSQIRAKDDELAQHAKEETKAVHLKDEEIKKLQTEMTLMHESVKEYRDDNEQLSKLNKELKFELQSYKYKVLDLQNKLFENQINTPREKKDSQHPAK